MTADRWQLRSGERQVAETLDGICPHHVARYRWAAEWIANQGLESHPTRILDIGCGCGYGAAILKTDSTTYHGIDLSLESIAFARYHYGGPGRDFEVGEACEPPAPVDVVVALEIIEHVPDYMAALTAWRACCKWALIVSIPIGCRTVADGHGFHVRDFTAGALSAGLYAAGFVVQETRLQTHGHAFEALRDPAQPGKSILMVARAMVDA